MAVFRLQEHLPDVYSRKSRDFQLLCNVFDCMNDGVKFDIDSIRDITDTELCNERLLNFLQTKLGFFTDKTMNTRTQRIVLKAFPYLIKNKGSRKGIEQAIQVFLKTQGITGAVSVLTTNKSTVTDISRNDITFDRISNVYIVELGIQSKLLDTTILNELLKYIIPAGYIIDYSFFKSYNIDEVQTSSDTVKIIFVERALHSGLRINNNLDESSVNAVGTVIIPDNTITEAATDIKATVIKDVVETEANYSETEIGDK